MFSVNVMAEVEAKKSNSGKGASMNESESLTLAMSAENKLSSMTKSTEQKDMYWFAHAADPPQEKPRRGLGSQSPDSPDLENETLSHSPPQQRVESPSKQHDIKSPSEPQIPRTLADIYWFAQGGEALTPSADLASDSGFSDGKEALCPLTQKEREEKARYIREKQAEERLRRFNEIKQQQMNAQHNREQQEEERRRKIEEYRQRDQERRNAVEERKRQIWEAEQERREALLRRNLDRESKLEARRYAQRSSTSFVFGSSTPRTLDLDVGILGGRSSSILFAASGGRRSEERDVDGSKKRAISACSLDRRPGEDAMTRSLICMSSRGRRKTDLTPSVPSSWDRSSRTQSPGIQTTRAVSTSRLDLLAQPRRRYTGSVQQGTGQVQAATIRKDPSSRPQSSLSQASDVSPSSSQASANLRPRTCSRRPRPISIAGSTPDKAILESTANHRQARSVDKKVVAQASRMSRAKPTSPEVSKEVAKPPTTHKPAVKQRPAALNQKPKIPTSAEPAAPSGLSTERISIVTEPPAPIDIAAASIETSSAKTIPLCDSNKSDEHINKLETMKDIQETPPEPAVTPEIATKTDLEPEISLKSDLKVEMLMDADIEHEIPTEVSHKPGIPVETVPKPEIQTQLPLNEVESRQKIESFKDEPLVKSPLKSETPLKPSPGVVLTPTGTPTGKPRITSEEEAKAALAEKRRLAREQAEREAELERQRQEELRRKEEERLRLEEEEQRKQEEEQIRLAEEHRRQEEEKLQRAIEEQKKREEEEQKRFEEESRMKAEKEEQERRAREETEKQRKELEEKLKKEEAERAERKKRVEQIMSRTRARGTAQLTGKTDVAESSKTPSPENEQRQSLDEKKSPEPSDGREVKQKTLCFSNIDQKAEGDDKDPVTVVSAVSETKNLLVDTSNNKSVDLLANVDSSIVTNNDLIFPVIDQQWNKELSLKSVSNNSHTNGFHTNSQNDGLINGTGNLKKEEPLLDLDTTITSSGHHSEFEQLIDISNTSPAQHHVHSLLSNVDQLNSNRVTPIIAFEEVTRKQEALMPDLLS
ncbi:uncharacterized protein LOC143250436 isoform X33 [Tachypleus tridentatus]|uniref:uncharacterized protein LOC143250436 isoform X33 n=1 Tax=Tachypleus tridentatus TaxID=6853 RepID=UPI003FD274CD